MVQLVYCDNAGRKGEKVLDKIILTASYLRRS